MTINRREILQGAAALAVTQFGTFATAQATMRSQIALLLDSSAPTPVAIAFEKVRVALRELRLPFEDITSLEATHIQTVLVAGLAGSSKLVADLSREFHLELPAKPESFLIQHIQLRDKGIWIACGSDPLGLAYALYDIADRITWAAPAASPLGQLQNSRESPSVRDRSLSIYSMQQAYFEKRLFDERYWASYLDNLVRNRFNNFSMLFAYESSGFLSPPYPWFFDLSDFAEVKAVGVTKEQQLRYLRALNRLIEMTHDRGLKFTLGIWDHIYDGVSSYYTEGVWDHLPMVNGRRPRWPVEGLTDKNLVAYTPKALERFLELVPNIDAIQFRMHGESGLNKAGLKVFWVPIFKVMAQNERPIGFDARAKDFPNDLIETALHMGVKLRLTTKYMAEQVGLPFHPTHVQRFDQFQTRNSYFDMLRYPQQYKVQWTLWTSGTTRVFLWGDSEYARRFVETTHLYDGDGFEVMEPLATKMASKPHDLPPTELINSGYRYYDYEFERYWAFFSAFGRFGYNLDTSRDMWRKQFEFHYGAAAPYIERALSNASGILPRIMAYSMPLSKFPTTRGWAERQRWEDLPDYALAEPSDVQLFASFQEEADALITGVPTVKVLPHQTSEWFTNRAKVVIRQVDEAGRQAGRSPSKELFSTMVDLRMLAHLAEYHSRRIQAGIQYAVYQKSGDLFAFDAAIVKEQEALQAWQALADSAEDVYSSDLAMGLGETEKTNRPGADLAGHWRDEIPKIRLGIEKLEKERAKAQPEYRRVVGKYCFDKNAIEPGYQLLTLKKNLSLDVPNGCYELQFVVQDGPTNPRGLGPMWIEANGTDRTDTFTVNPGDSVERTLTSEVHNKKLNVMLANESTGESNVSRMIVTRIQPLIIHVPVWKVPVGEGAVLRATVNSKKPIRYVRTVFKDLSGRFKTREMRCVGPFQYELALSPADCNQGGSYFLVVSDNENHISTHPDDGPDRPIVMTVQHAFEPSSLMHTAISDVRPNKPLRVAASVKCATGLQWVRLRYRSVNQYQDYYALDMLPTGEVDRYEAEIPPEHIPSEWDFMYFFEVMDKDGNGRIFPDFEKETPYIVVKLDRHSV
jgi:hypothetical protein